MSSDVVTMNDLPWWLEHISGYKMPMEVFLEKLQNCLRGIGVSYEIYYSIDEFDYKSQFCKFICNLPQLGYFRIRIYTKGDEIIPWFKELNDDSITSQQLFRFIRENFETGVEGLKIPDFKFDYNLVSHHTPTEDFTFDESLHSSFSPIPFSTE